MNFAVSCRAASGFAAGCFGDRSACAWAPETISALTAAEITRVLSIVASCRPCIETTLEHPRVFRVFGTQVPDRPLHRAVCVKRGQRPNGARLHFTRWLTR